eukprot:TRINITY_DN34_c0_g1_i1.p1 TRINITY_DN34_c0_g1~~TRINITY_DN34_c0_g1_i1.p1  ORF type:complete len:255 (+),score=62.76 TRINITY_DN34_c0_g1_i1:398-1162(+)
MTDDISEERKKLIYRARLSEHCERYEDMVEDMKSVALNFSPMDVEERNLMSVGYKNVVGQRRTALRTFKYLADHQPSSQIDEYITRVEEELDKRCNEILCQILSQEFIEKCERAEDRVFYLKMKGDYYRYMAEYKKGEEKKDVSEKSLIEYNKALEEAEVLNSTDTIKLGLALNFSVFYYEIISDHHKAIELAQKALDDARNNIDQMEDADYKDATLILQLLSDNLNLWKNDIGDPVDEVNGDVKVPENDVDET